MKKQEIDPRRVQQDFCGQVLRRWFVRLPAEMILDDVKDPTIWRRVQLDRMKALRRHDEVYLVGYGEDFAVSARVTDATSEAVVLGGMKIINFPERITPLFNDGTYRVAWVGTGYAVERIADGHQLGGAHGSEALAIREIQSLYPRPVA